MRALVLSGGGSKGSWQAGAILALANEPRFFTGFGFVSGTSVGAINAAGMAMHNRNELPQAAAYLRRMWSDKLSIWRKRFPPYLAGAWNPSIGVNDGLRDLLDRELDLERIKKSNVRLSVSAVDLLDGAVVRFTDKDPNLKKAILASSSFPIAFPPEELDGGYYTDGGVRDIAPLKPAIEAGAEHIVVIVTSNPYSSGKKKRGDFGNVIQVAERVVSLMLDEIVLNDVKMCRMRNRRPSGHDRKIKVTVLHPRAPLADSLDFDQDTMKKQIEQGYAEAKIQLDESSRTGTLQG